MIMTKKETRGSGKSKKPPIKEITNPKIIAYTNDNQFIFSPFNYCVFSYYIASIIENIKS